MKFISLLPDLDQLYKKQSEKNLNELELVNDITVVDRLKNIIQFLTKKKPKIKINENSYIDFANNEIKIDGDLKINITGNLYINSSKHIILNSGQKEEENRKGYNYSIWLNSKLDENGNPLKKEDTT